MNEYRIKWQQCPRVQHPSQILFVNADSPETATAVARDHIERTFGCGWFMVDEVTLYLRPQNGTVSTK